jgi:hypothetical protein
MIPLATASEAGEEHPESVKFTLYFEMWGVDQVCDLGVYLSPLEHGAIEGDSPVDTNPFYNITCVSESGCLRAQP